jgi:arginyl-tRNA synthetase
LQYAYTRIQSIIRRSELDISALNQAINLEQDAEIALAQKLIQFSDAVHNVANKGMPHMMCNYLYELAGAFMTFYEACPILKDVNEQQKCSRLRLADLTAKVLNQGLSLLGIETLERM